MWPGIVIVVEVVRKDAVQMPFVQHDHVVEALPTYRTDDAFAIGIHSRRQLHPIATMRVKLFG